MKKKLSIIYVILWMLLIFIMSSFNANESSIQSNFIVDIIANIFNINNIKLLSFLIRKLAHITEYFILSLLVINMLKQYNKNIYLSIFICILYAITDEFHQLFVNGRGCSIKDVLIDSIGICLSILVYKIIKKNLKNRKV